MADNQQPPPLFQQPSPDSIPVVGNVISSVYSSTGANDIFSIAESIRRARNPTLTIARRDNSSATTYNKLFDIQLQYGARFTRIAANRRDFSVDSRQASVFYQDYTGDVYEARLNTAGSVLGYYRVDTIVATESTPNTPTNNAAMMGTSFATVVIGQARDTAYVFYQARDNRIYFVWQTAFGEWSEPSLVVADPTFGPTTLTAVAWEESEKTGTGTVDGITLIYNQTFDLFRVVEIRIPRSDPGTVTPFFQLVAAISTPRTRGPFSAVRFSATKTNESTNKKEAITQYQIYAQYSTEPPSVFELEVVVQDGSLQSKKARTLISDTKGVRVPARGASITSLLFPETAGVTSPTYSIAIGWTTREGRVVGGIITGDNPSALQAQSRAKAAPLDDEEEDEEEENDDLNIHPGEWDNL